MSDFNNISILEEEPQEAVQEEEPVQETETEEQTEQPEGTSTEETTEETEETSESTEEESTEETSEEETEEQEPEPRELSQDEVNEFISSNFEGIQSLDDVNKLIEKNKELEQKVNEVPEFDDENKQQLWNAINNAEGNGVSVDQALRVQSLDVDNLDNKTALYENFLQDPQNATLSREEARRYFELEFEENYGSEEDDQDEKQKLKLKRDASSAKSKLKEVKTKLGESVTPQSDDTSTQEKSDEEKQQEQKEQDHQEKLQQDVNKYVDDFGGLQYQFDENADAISFPAEKFDEKDLNTIKQYAMDPSKMLSDWLQEYVDPKTGEFDINGWSTRVAELHKIDDLKEHIGKEMFTAGQQKKMNEIKNPPKEPKNHEAGEKLTGEESRNYNMIKSVNGQAAADKWLNEKRGQ